MALLTLLINAGLLVCALVGGLIAYREYKTKRRLDKADYLRRMVMLLREDKEIRKFIQDVDLGRFVFDGSFHGSEKELIADKTLEILSYICYLRQEKCLSDREFAFFEYELNRVLTDAEVLKYLNFITTFAKNVELSEVNAELPNYPFKALLEYALANKLIQKQ